MKIFIVVISFFTLLLSWQEAVAWGGRGHHTLCDAATFVVQEKELRQFLTSRPHTMGHLCNIPDIAWRSLPGEMTKEGNPGHFFDWEIIGGTVKDFPLDYKKIIADFEGKKKANEEGFIRSIPHEFGSLWWRADQFYRRALVGKEALAASALGATVAATEKADKKEKSEKEKVEKKKEESDDSAFNKAVYEFYVNLGIMGHFVGDNAQPLHTTSDYDGYGKGHGGIHGYYEDVMLSAMDGDLQFKVMKEARKMRSAERKEKFLVEKTLLEKMRALSVASNADIDLILMADLLKKPSEQVEERGMKIRKPAEREPIEKTKAKFEPLLVKHLARGVALLSLLWDEAYREAGSPKLSTYKSFKYPLVPEFVYPDYYEIKKDESAKK